MQQYPTMCIISIHSSSFLPLSVVVQISVDEKKKLASGQFALIRLLKNV